MKLKKSKCKLNKVLIVLNIYNNNHNKYKHQNLQC